MKEPHVVRRIIADLDRAKQLIDATYLAEVKQLDAELKQLQSECGHGETKYFPDASGNNDSWTECEICGKEL